MARGTVSAADGELLAKVRARGLRCSAFQLERWRTAGLLPRNYRTFPGAGGSVSAASPEVIEIAVVLAGAARRGRPPQELALAVFAAGLPVSGDVLTAAIVWAAEQVTAMVEAFAVEADAAVRELPPHIERFGDIGELADAIAAAAATRNGPAVIAMRRRLRAAHPARSRSELAGDVLAALSQLARLVLSDPNQAAGMAHPAEWEELLAAVGLGAQVADLETAPRSLFGWTNPQALLRAARMLTPEAPDALYWGRTQLLKQAAQIASGGTGLPAELIAAHPQDPVTFAMEVLTVLIAVALNAEEAAQSSRPDS